MLNRSLMNACWLGLIVLILSVAADGRNSWAVAPLEEQPCLPIQKALSLRFSDIQRLIVSCQLKSVEDLIPLLPDAYRRNFTLMRRSRALFSSSVAAEHPRVISFGHDANLILAFNSDPAKAGFDTVEAIDFDPETAVFSMHRVDLPGRGSNERARFHPKNPPVCLSCHGQDPRPIWESYDLWPGAYGSEDDTIDPESQEGKDYVAFLARARKTGLFQHLTWKDTSPVYPYTLRGDRSLNISHVPNSRLTLALNGLNAERIARKIIAAPGFRDDPARFIALLLGCERPGVEALSASDVFLEDLKAKRIRHGNSQAGRGFGETQESIPGAVRLKKLAVEIGVSSSDFPLLLPDDGFFFADGLRPFQSLVLGSLVNRLKSAEARNADEIWELLKPYQMASSDYGRTLLDALAALAPEGKSLVSSNDAYAVTGFMNLLASGDDVSADEDSPLRDTCASLQALRKESSRSM